MNLATLLLTAALSLLNFVVAHPSDPGNIQRIHFAEQAFELSNYYQTNLPEVMTEQNTGSASGSSSSSPDVVLTPTLPAPSFVGTTSVELIAANTFRFSWKSSIPATGEVWLYSSPDQRQAFHDGNYEGGIMQTPTAPEATEGSIQVQFGGSMPYAIIIRANGQIAVSTGKIIQ